MTKQESCETTCKMKELSAHVATLRELTEHLPEVPHGGAPQVRYHGAGGDWIGMALWHDGGVAVQICMAPEGMTLPRHAHEAARERLVVVEGLLRIDIAGIVNTYGPGDCAEFAPGQVHEVTTVKPTRIVAITVPAEESYPYGHDHLDADD